MKGKVRIPGNAQIQSISDCANTRYKTTSKGNRKVVHYNAI